jgi:hypothetical protein
MWSKLTLPLAFVCTLEGLALALLAAMSTDFFGYHTPSFVQLALAALGAIGGGVIGVFLQGPPGRGRTVAGWCHWTAWIVGGVGFLIGFVGPLLLEPDSPQGPLLGIFITGPLGAVAGAIIGVLIGLVVPSKVRPKAEGKGAYKEATGEI